MQAKVRWENVMVPTPEPPEWARNTASEIMNYINHHSAGQSDKEKELEIAAIAVQCAQKRMTIDTALMATPVCNFSIDRQKEQVVLDTPDRTYYANTAQQCLEKLEVDIEASH